MALSARDAVARLNDTRSVAHGVAWTAANAAILLVDPRRLGARGRLLYRLANGVLAAWTAWAAMRTDLREEVPAVATAGYATGAAGVLMAAAEMTEGVDSRLHDGLARRGVRRPRVLMAAGGAALAAVAWWTGRRGPVAPADDDAFVEPADETVEETIELPDEVRVLVEALLAADEGYGSAELRAQLASARAVRYEGPDPEGFWPGIGLEVPGDLPLSVPGDANFPVVGLYRPLDGRAFEVYLTVLGGRLSTLSISEGRDWTEDEQVEWMEAGRGVHELPGWPDPADLELHVETPGGLRPVSA